MSITDELREFANKAETLNTTAAVTIRLRGIADHIDAAHERELREQYDKGLNDGYDVGFASADGQSWLQGYGECHAELMEGNEGIAADLEKAGWVKLPKDAAGEYIRVGDKLDGYKETIVVDEMALQYGSWALVSDDRRAFHCPEAFTHHKTTVEDVLREFMDELRDAPDDAIAELTARYARRAREAAEHA